MREAFCLKLMSYVRLLRLIVPIFFVWLSPGYPMIFLTMIGMNLQLISTKFLLDRDRHGGGVLMYVHCSVLTAGDHKLELLIASVSPVGSTHEHPNGTFTLIDLAFIPNPSQLRYVVLSFHHCLTQTTMEYNWIL